MELATWDWITAQEREGEGRGAGPAPGLPEPPGSPLGTGDAPHSSPAIRPAHLVPFPDLFVKDLSSILLLCVFTLATSWGYFIYMSNTYLLGDCDRALYQPRGHLIEGSRQVSPMFGVWLGDSVSPLVFCNPDLAASC